VKGGGLYLDSWFDDPAYKRAQGFFTTKGAFILGKLREHNAPGSAAYWMTCTEVVSQTRRTLRSFSGR